ncbi:hypothetical protein, partial [Nocardia wallacei]|uniref:hypothetical protein n=1 Tax=Nocardia wallacei TaxID=480035 RepID=UPI0024578B1D
RAEEEAAAARRAEEEAAAARRAEEEAAAARRAEEEAAAARRAEEEAAAARRAEEEAAARRRAEEEAAARRRAEEEAAARRRAEEEAPPAREEETTPRPEDDLLEHLGRAERDIKALADELKQHRYALQANERLAAQFERHYLDAAAALSKGDIPSFNEHLGQARDVLKAARDAYREGDLRAAEGFSKRKLIPKLKRNESQRSFTKDEYVEHWEKKLGRKMTPEEIRTIERGCIGVSMVRLGRDDSLPPMNLVFDDPVAQARVAVAEKELAAGEAASGRVNAARSQHRVLEHQLKEARDEPGATEDSPKVKAAREKVEASEKHIADLKKAAREEWSKLSETRRDELRSERQEAKIAGGEKTFERVSGYAEKFNEILSRKPATVEEFMRMVNEDPQLSQLKGIADQLPRGSSPSEWEAVIFSKHFYSGADRVHPDAQSFAPNPETGQVDMAGKRTPGKSGYVNFDYGWYDAQSGSWLHANHMEPKTPAEIARMGPMKVLQSTPQKFFSSYIDFDSAVIGIAFVRKA